jgi:hypothetical protein
LILFSTPGPCESFRRLRKITVGLEQDFSPFSYSSSIFASVVLSQVSSPGQETGADHGEGEVKETSTMAKSDWREKFKS